MKKTLSVAVLVLAVALWSIPAHADTTCSGGVCYTLTAGEVDSTTQFDVVLDISTGGATIAGTLNSIAVFFDGSSNVTLESGPSGWSVIGNESNNPAGCNSMSNPTFTWCSAGPTISVPDGSLEFVFDVTEPGGTLLTDSHIQAFQGQGVLAISNDVGIGPPTSAPEPASLALLGTGLFGLAGIARRRRQNS